MDIRVHKAILYYGMAYSGYKRKISSDFPAIWAGNWMTDINQASCVLDLLPEKAVKGLFKDNKGYKKYLKRKNSKVSPYTIFESEDSITYKLNPLLEAIEENWTSLIKELWKAEIESTTHDYRLTGDVGKNITGFDLQKIGMYYPLDHFDVVLNEDTDDLKDQIGNFTWTAHAGVYDHALNRLLKTAFDLKKSDMKGSLFYLGRSLHVLADFYSHSNFVSLILRYYAEKDKNNSISDYFNSSWEHLLFEKVDPGKVIPVMTGRFDKIDTIASILKIYKNFLIPDFNDFKESIVGIENNERLALMKSKIEQNETILSLNILFGTFSNIKLINEFKGIVILSEKVVDFLKRLTGEIRNDFLNIIDKIVENELNSTDSEHLIDFIKEMKTYDPDDAKSELKNHLKAGKVMYYEYMIQKTLVNNLIEHRFEYLPHHALIANDSDNSHPVKRLEYKMACYFAVTISKEIVRLYYKNGSLAEAESILNKYYVYPTTFYDANEDSIKRAINKMYGCRWWEYIQPRMKK